MKKSSRRKFIESSGIVVGGALANVISPAVTVAAAQSRPPAAAATPGARLRALLAGPEPVMAPGAHDVVSARLIQAEGYPVVVAGGSACASCMYGIPDVGLVTITELIEFSGRIARAVDVPVVADADDGGGTPINVYRSVQEFNKAGLAAVMIEDTYQAKHLGEGEELIPKEQFVDKIKAATDARLDQNLVIIGRCDAVSLGMSIEQAFDRGVAYAEAGADMIFFAGLRLQDCARAADAVKRPLMHTINNVPLEEVKKSRVNLAVYAGQVLSVALGAARQALREIKSTGIIPNYQQRVIPGAEQAQLLRTPDVAARAKKYHVSK